MRVERSEFNPSVRSQNRYNKSVYFYFCTQVQGFNFTGTHTSVPFVTHVLIGSGESSVKSHRLHAPSRLLWTMTRCGGGEGTRGGPRNQHDGRVTIYPTPNHSFYHHIKQCQTNRQNINSNNKIAKTTTTTTTTN